MSPFQGAPSGGLGAAAFWGLATLAVLAALGTVGSRRPIRSAIFLLANVLGLAGIYVLLQAHLLAALQLIVYAGAVVVLFVFVIMLLGPNAEPRRPLRALTSRLVGAATLAAVGGAVATVVWKVRPVVSTLGDFGTVRAVGHELFTKDIFLFEVAAILLTVAIVGAVAVARSRVSTRSGEGEAPKP